MAYKNDDPAKQAFIKKLTEEMEYEKAEVKAQPADIIAEKDGVTLYYEIKLTSEIFNRIDQLFQEIKND